MLYNQSKSSIVNQLYFNLKKKRNMPNPFCYKINIFKFIVKVSFVGLITVISVVKLISVNARV